MGTVKEKPRLTWSGLFLTAFLAAFLYVILEWIFAVTKPSFLNVLGAIKQIEILFFAMSLLAISCFALILPLALIGQMPIIHKFKGALIYAGALVPSVVLAATCLLLIDNFTYTIFHFGIVTSEGIARGGYAGIFFALIVLMYRWIVIPLLRYFSDRYSTHKVKFTVIAGFVILGPIALSIPGISKSPQFVSGGLAPMVTAKLRPNILLITGDGINASHMSAFGYTRETTPHIDELAKSSFLAANHFANAENTAGSIVSILTGKYPTNTHLLYPPDILRGPDSYQHLPGILHAQGYRTIQISAPHYVDAPTLNMIGAFDTANGRNAATEAQILPQLSQYLTYEYAYFIQEISFRITDRFMHILFIAQMPDAYEIVTKPADVEADNLKIIQLRSLLNRSTQPLFVHVHLLGTHGPTYNAPQIFSIAKAHDRQDWFDADFYDDSILEFDKNVGQLIDQLNRSGAINETILIIGSDHNQDFLATERIPLLIHFPYGEYSGQVQQNTQNLDIMPTVLDYLGLDVPGWVEGMSLLGDIPSRSIVSVGVGDGVETVSKGNFAEINVQKLTPPFYQFGRINVVVCKYWYSLDLKEPNWSIGLVEGYQGNCDQVLSDQQVFMTMKDHLKRYGFTVDALDNLEPAQAKTRP